MIVKIFTGPNNYDIEKLYKKDNNEYVIGVDYGAYKLTFFDVKIDLAVGDFDSVDKSELLQIKSKAKNVISLNKGKNETDTYIAVKYALELNPDKIIIYGGIGNRVDHFMANLNLLKLGNICLVNNDCRLFILSPGVYDVKNNYKYISFFAVEDVVDLTLSKFEYTLNNYYLSKIDSRCISNEGSGSIGFTKGQLLVIMSNE